MRAETGSMRFGDDWTGVFIRGDDAMFQHGWLKLLLEETDIDPISTWSLKVLLEALGGYKDKTPVNKLRPIEECTDEP